MEARDLCLFLDRFLPILRGDFLHDKRVLLLIDELELVSHFPEEIQNHLRCALSRFDDLRLIGAGTPHGLERLEITIGSSFFNMLYRIWLAPLERKEMEVLITKPVKGRFHYDEKAVEDIITMGSGRPYQVQYLCKKAVDSVIEKETDRITSDMIRSIFYDYLLPEQIPFIEERWKKFSPEIREFFLEMVLPINGQFTEIKIKKRSLPSEVLLDLKRSNIYDNKRGGAYLEYILLEWVHLKKQKGKQGREI